MSWSMNLKVEFLLKKWKWGGVGYVASYPENCGQGDINHLIKEIILELYKQNYTISSLAPFSESFIDVMAMKMPESSLLGEFFPEQEGLKGQILPYMMTRIINIEQVLDALHLINAGKINIEITDDEIVTENNGTWEIDQINKEIKVRKTKRSWL